MCHQLGLPGLRGPVVAVPVCLEDLAGPPERVQDDLVGGVVGVVDGVRDRLREVVQLVLVQIICLPAVTGFRLRNCHGASWV